MMNKEEMSEEVKRLNIIIEEKKSNTQKILYLDDIFEKIEKNYFELYSLIDDYRNLSYPNLFEGKKKLSEDEDEKEKDLIEKMRIHIKNISQAIGELTKVLNSNGKLKFRNIDNANSNLINIAGTSDYLKRMYNRLAKDNKILLEIFHLLLDAEKSLDFFIEKYNNTHKEKLHSLGNALHLFNSDTPKA